MTVKLPKVIVDHLKERKHRNKSLVSALCNPPYAIAWWFDIYKNQELFAEAWLYGCEILAEKKYTVVLTNPNSKSKIKHYLRKNAEGFVCLFAGIPDETSSDNQLTESEIKNEFNWAWQFAKEVK